jgi:hypothetical protein
MSEYQYYEFRTIDRFLTPEQMSDLRALSSRAEITPNSFTNTYNYGDFRGNPRKLMESYFDAHVYVSNFGTLTFMLRLPQTVIPDDTLALYAVEDSLDWWTTDEHTIVDWQLNEDGGGDWVEVRSFLERIIHGEGMRVQTELQSRFYRSHSDASKNSRSKAGGSRRTAAELLTTAEQMESERKLNEQKERDRKRSAHLAGLVPRFSELWSEVNALAEEQKATPYDRATALLVDMRAAYVQAGRRPEFDAEFARYLERYSRSTAFVRRLKEAKLMS